MGPGTRGRDGVIQTRGDRDTERHALRVPLGPGPEPSPPRLGGLGRPRQGKEVPEPLLRGPPARSGDLGLGPGRPPVSV